MTEPTTHIALIAGARSDVLRPVLEALAARNVRGVVVADRASARQQLDRQRVCMVVLDTASFEPSADLMFAELRRQAPDLPVVALGPDADVAAAVEAIRAGATDYLPTPIRPEMLDDLLGRLLPDGPVQSAAVDIENDRCVLRIAGNSEALCRTVELARRVARSSVPVLITGESGTGKELVSYLVHRESRRAGNPYIRVNCAALSESLLESELFGHERGAFTGAVSDRKGRFELAHRGTLLLDEISETGPRLQAELLRVLEQQDFHRVGGTESVHVDVRVICTSNRDLAAEVEEGNFRRDLYYRIRGLQLDVPALRDRVEDIPSLVWHFVNLYAAETGRRIETLDDAMLATFASYSWPGNVRQLRNVIRGALILGAGDTLSLDDAPQLRQELQGGSTSTMPRLRTLSLQDLEREAVFEAMRRADSHQGKAARMLGISDRTLRDKLRRYREDEQTGEPTWLASRAS